MKKILNVTIFCLVLTSLLSACGSGNGDGGGGGGGGVNVGPGGLNGTWSVTSTSGTVNGQNVAQNFGGGTIYSFSPNNTLTTQGSPNDACFQNRPYTISGSTLTFNAFYNCAALTVTVASVNSQNLSLNLPNGLVVNLQNIGYQNGYGGSPYGGGGYPYGGGYNGYGGGYCSYGYCH